jgi:hypothetical protein
MIVLQSKTIKNSNTDKEFNKDQLHSRARIVQLKKNYIKISLHLLNKQ